jgi:hypothetical protein
LCNFQFGNLKPIPSPDAGSIAKFLYYQITHSSLRALGVSAVRDWAAGAPGWRHWYWLPTFIARAPQANL